MESHRQAPLLFHEIEAAIATKKRENGITTISDFQKHAGLSTAYIFGLAAIIPWAFRSN
jgi:hypothetical protein